MESKVLPSESDDDFQWMVSVRMDGGRQYQRNDSNRRPHITSARFLAASWRTNSNESEDK